MKSAKMVVSNLVAIFTLSFVFVGLLLVESFQPPATTLSYAFTTSRYGSSTIGRSFHSSITVYTSLLTTKVDIEEDVTSTTITSSSTAISKGSDSTVVDSPTDTTTTDTVSSNDSNNKEDSEMRLQPSSTDDIHDESTPLRTMDACVCGGGPAGLLTAIMLAKQTLPSGLPRFPKIALYDRLSPPPSPEKTNNVWIDEIGKFYLIGLGGRGQTALRKFGLWDEYVEPECVHVVGRCDWSPGGNPDGVEVIFGPDRPAKTQVLPRDKLGGILHQYILNNLSDRIELNFNTEVQPVTFDYDNGNSALIRISACTNSDFASMNPSSVRTAYENVEDEDAMCDPEGPQLVSTSLLVAADGTVRTVANTMEELDKERIKNMKNPISKLFAKPFRVKRYDDDNQRVYKTVPLKLPKDWKHNLNYSARTDGSKINFDALPANDQGDYCGVLLIKKDNPLARANANPKDLRKAFDQYLPQFSKLLSDEMIDNIAQKPISYLPGFIYAGPRLHQGNCCVLLGDCAHTVKPYFGLGANSALEDVEEFADYLEANPYDTAKAIKEFSRHRAPESKTLVRISRDLDRPGKLGVLTFLIPIILDGIFSKLMPNIFKPNIISMLQRDQYTFQQLARRKRIDRILQLLIVGSFLTGVGFVASAVVKYLAPIIM